MTLPRSYGTPTSWKQMVARDHPAPGSHFVNDQDSWYQIHAHHDKAAGIVNQIMRRYKQTPSQARQAGYLTRDQIRSRYCHSHRPDLKTRLPLIN
jgi:hypothetical protein